MSGRSYKQTLNLPRTDFPMRAGLARREPETLERWERERIYERMVARRREQGAPRFIMHDGPPYANGGIHIGHILNKVLKDIVVKHRLMSGHCAEFVPGWDCHGLPIELKVDEELGARKAEMSDVEIRRACRAYAQRYVERQRDDFRRVLVLADWARPYRTMDAGYEAQIVRELGTLIERGYVRRGLKPVYWSWAAETALAEAEVEYHDHTSPSIYVKFALPEPPAALVEAAGGRPVSVVIWTTTPWTLPANLAIALHPEADYALLGTGAGDALVVAEALADEVVRVCRLGDVERLASFKADALAGHRARHPFIERDSVLLIGEHVTLDTGTGAVHTAPGHGADDYLLGRAHGLEAYSPVDHRGRFTAQVPEYEGQLVFDANPKIVAALAASGHLLSPPSLSVEHRYAYCWRTKKPTIFRATPQWFVMIDHDGLRERALEAIAKTRWLPEWGEERIHNMIAHRPDWCISRQRRWGVPVPLLYCEGCGEVLMDGGAASKLAELSEVATCDVWWERPAGDFLPDGAACGACGNADPARFRKEMDIVDVWIDSGVSFAAVTERRLGEPGVKADLYLEGSDQHRGWFHSSLLMSLATRGQAPYEAVLTHGFVLDEQGRKYSKSSANYVAPSEIIDTHGAEILRMWVASEDVRSDLSFSKNIVKQVSDIYRKIRNTWRFMLGMLGDFEPGRDARPLSEADDLDRWALLRAERWLEAVRERYEAYDFTGIFRETINLCTTDLSAFYLDVLKDRLYASAPDWAARRASQTVIYRILHAMVRALAPILSFTADEAWRHLPRLAGEADEVFLSDFPERVSDLALDDAAAGGLWDAWLQLRDVRGAVQAVLEEARRDKLIGSSQQAALTLRAEGALLELLERHREQLAEVMIVASVALERGAPPAGALVGVTVAQASGDKCPRCWNHREDIGQTPDYSDVCGRCAQALAEGADATA